MAAWLLPDLSKHRLGKEGELTLQASSALWHHGVVLQAWEISLSSLVIRLQVGCRVPPCRYLELEPLKDLASLGWLCLGILYPKPHDGVEDVGEGVEGGRGLLGT